MPGWGRGRGWGSSVLRGAGSIEPSLGGSIKRRRKTEKGLPSLNRNGGCNQLFFSTSEGWGTKHEAALWERGYVRAKVCSSFGIHCGYCGHLDVSWPFHQRGKQPFGPCLNGGKGKMGFGKTKCLSPVYPMGLCLSLEERGVLCRSWRNCPHEGSVWHLGTGDAHLVNTEWGRGTKFPSGLDLGVVRTPGNSGCLALGVLWFESPGASALGQMLVSSQRAP